MREIFESTLERLLGDLAGPDAVLASEGGHWPKALWDAVEASGFGLAAAPESAGGAGAGWDDLYVVLTACGRHAAPVPLPETLLANWLLGQAGIEARSGPLSFAAASTLAWTSGPDGGSVEGSLSDVPWGRDVAHVVALVDAPVPRVVLLAASDAVRREGRLNIAGEPRDDLHFAGARPLASADLPGHLPRDVLKLGGALLRATQTAGALQAALALCTSYATERVQFGKPIGSFQAIAHHIAVLAEQVALVSVSAEAACVESAVGLAPLPIIAARINAAEACGIAAGIAHAVHGAIGFTHEHRLHLTTRRLWAWRSEFGSSSDWSQRLGRAVGVAGAEGYWPAVTAGDFAGLARDASKDTAKESAR